MGWEPESRIKERAEKAIIAYLGGNSTLVRSANIHVLVENQEVKGMALVGFARGGLTEAELNLIYKLDALAGKKQSDNGTNVSYSKEQTQTLLNLVQTKASGFSR